MAKTIPIKTSKGLKALNIIPTEELYPSDSRLKESSKTGLTWHRIEEIARYSPPVFSVISTRIKQIVSLDWEIIPIGDEEKALRNEVYYYAGLHEELKDVKEFSKVANESLEKLKKMLDYLKPDLSNLDACYKRARAKIRERNRKETDKVRNFFRRPNREEDFSEFQHKLLWDLLVFGKASIYKVPSVERAIAGSGPFSEMVTLKGSSVFPKRGQHVLSIEGYYQYNPNRPFNMDSVVEFDLDEIVYLQYMPTNYSVHGLTPIEVIVLLVAEALYYDHNRISEYEQGKPPKGLLLLSMYDEESEKNSTVPLAPEEKEKAEDAVNQPEKASDDMIEDAIKVMTGVDKAEFIDFGRKETDYKGLERQDFIQRVACQVYNMSPQEVGMIEDVNRSTAEVQEQSERRKGIKPIVQEIENKYTIDVIQPMGHPKLSFNFTSEENRRAKAKIIKDEVTTYKAVNEVRVEEGRDPFPEKEYDRPIISVGGGQQKEETGEEKD